MISKSYTIENNSNFFLENNSILFFGENLGLKKDFKNKVKLLHPKAFNITFHQDEILKDSDILFQEIMNSSLFEEEKVIIIEQASDKIYSYIEEILKNIKNNKLIIFAEQLDKKSKLRNYYEKSNIFQTVACYPDDALSLKKIIFNKLNGFKGLSNHNINLIINSTSLDRIKLNNELNKILTFFQNKSIDTDKLNKLLDRNIDENFNNIKDQAMLGNKQETNKLLSDTLIDADKNIFYLAVINQRLNKLSETFELSKNSNIENAIAKIRPPVFWKDKPNLLLQAKKWDNDKIKKLSNKTYNLEIKMKSNSLIDKNILMKKLIVDICNLANS